MDRPFSKVYKFSLGWIRIVLIGGKETLFNERMIKTESDVWENIIKRHFAGFV